MSRTAKFDNTRNLSKIVGIQFSILSPEEILKGSVAEITSRDTYVVACVTVPLYTHTHMRFLGLDS